MDIKRSGSPPSGKGPADWFTGTVRIDPLLTTPAPARGNIISVTFEPGARTLWHTHPLGQTLIVTHGCGRAQLPKPEWGRYTQKGNRLYAHILERGIGPVNLRGLAGKIGQARLLADGSELKLDRPWMAADFSGDAFLDFPSSCLPDEIDTVVELELI